MTNKKTIYLDYAAATPLDGKVLASMQPYWSDTFYNPSAAYQPAREVRVDIENARKTISQIMGAKPGEIIFTAGATESINLAFTVGGHIVTSSIEHLAVLKTVEQFDHSIVGVNEKGLVNIDELQLSIRDDTKLVSIGLVNNEIGTVQSLGPVVQLIKNIRNQRRQNNNKTPLFLHTDASQAVGIIDINVSRLGVDMMTLNGGKIYGPKQTGILYADSSVQLRPIVIGGGQERGLRSGTENVAGIIGFTKALEIAEKKRKTEVENLTGLRMQMLNILQKEFSDLIVIGDQKHHAPHILTVAWPSLDAERILFGLEAQDVLVATGSACAANKDTRSHVLIALGLEPKIIDGSLRFSFGRQTNAGDIDRAAKIIVMTIQQELTRGKRD